MFPIEAETSAIAIAFSSLNLELERIEVTSAFHWRSARSVFVGWETAMAMMIPLSAQNWSSQGTTHRQSGSYVALSWHRRSVLRLRQPFEDILGNRLGHVRGSSPDFGSYIPTVPIQESADTRRGSLPSCNR